MATLESAAAGENASDREIVRFLAKDVFSEFSINTELLNNWQIEFSDGASDPHLLAAATRQEIVLQSPPGPVYFTETHKKQILVCIEKLDALDSDVYVDFALIVYEVISYVTSATYTGKLQLFRCGFADLLIDSLVTHACRLNDDSTESQRLVYGAKFRLLGAYFELGCDSKQFKRLLFPLFARTTQLSFTGKRAFLEVFYTFLDRCPNTYLFLLFNNFICRPVAIPINSGSRVLKSFTVSSWLKLNVLPGTFSQTDELLGITLFLLANSTENEPLVFHIQLCSGKFIASILSWATKSKRHFSFNHVLKPDPYRNQGYTHFVLTYDSFQNLNLYVDGEYCESIPCSAISKADIRWNKLYIGDPEEPLQRENMGANLFTKQEMLVKDLAILDLALSFEWVSLAYFLGMGYDWGHKEFADLNIVAFLDSLSKRNYIRMCYRAEEILYSKGQLVSHRGETRPTSAKGKINGYHLPNKQEIASLLMKTKVGNASYLFDSNDAQFVQFIGQAKNYEIFYHRHQSFCNLLYCWGGSGLLLSLVEAVMKDEYHDEKQRHYMFYGSLRLLLSCLQSDWRLSKEFENIDGYWCLVLILDYYKGTFNPDLVFENWQTYEETSERHALEVLSPSACDGSILKMLLNFATARESSGPIIADFPALKFVVFNFDLFSNTASFASVRGHVTELLAAEKYKGYNFQELGKMRVLKRLLQHVKAGLFQGDSARAVEESTRLLDLFIHFDFSVEAIKHVSQFIIFTLYNKPADAESQKAGLQALLALTNKLCGSSLSMRLLKKFLRSISIHWILLLLRFKGANKQVSAKVVCCAIELLAKFLRVLGPNLIRRFFHANRGLNVLSHFLQSWWNNDTVISVLFINSFGIDSETYGSEIPSLPKLVADKGIHGSGNTPIPDFIIILNHLALAGVIQLSQIQGKVMSTPSSPLKGNPGENPTTIDQITDLSFDIVHLLNQISDMVEVGYNDSATLQAIFVSNEWLESAFEIVAHLKTFQELAHPSRQVWANIELCFSRFVSVLSNVFVSMLLENRKLLAIMETLSDITRMLMIDTIFPRIFAHINRFFSNSTFIFNEVEFLRGAREILGIYYNEFVVPHYVISRDDLSAFMACLVAIIETCDTQDDTMSQLGPILGHVLVMQFSGISRFAPNENRKDDTEDAGKDGENCRDESAADLNEHVKFCLFKQALVLHPSVLNKANLRLVIEIVMGNFLCLSSAKQLEIAEHLFNFLRAAMVIRENEFGAVLAQLTQLCDYHNAREVLSDFFAFLSSHNDEECVKYLQRNPTARHIFSQNFHFQLSKVQDVGQISVQDMVQVVLNSGGRLNSDTSSAQLHAFESDCLTLKAVVITGELVKYNRELQDMQENVRYYSAAYSSMVVEIHRLLKESPVSTTDFMLDYIEGANRMRMLLVGKDHIPGSEKLTYSVKVPLKQVAVDAGALDRAAHVTLDSAFAAFDIGDLRKNLDVDMDEYEEIDENGEPAHDSTFADCTPPITTSTTTKPMGEDRNRKVLRSLYLGDQIQALYNVSKVNGLDAIESLMIVGYTHLYFIESFFHCADGNVVDIDEVPLALRDPCLQFIRPQKTDAKTGKSYRIKTWTLASFACVCKRKFLLRDIALELFFDDGASLLITCLSRKQRDTIYTKLSSYSSGDSLDKDLQITLEVSSSSSSSSSLQQTQTSSSSGLFLRSRLASAFSAGFTSGPTFLEITKKWKSGKMSNFYYLLAINTMAGRTFNDLTQYPVFPWVIADYESAELDLNNPNTFRDLSKPMGAQTPKRAQEYKERYDALASMNDGNAPPFHYGTHYSSAMIVTSYLIRLRPYVQSYLLLQGGKFDHADRLFNSVGKAWLSASKENTTDVRELTPEFFYLPEFLANKNHFELGTLHNGASSNDVVLPKWARGDPKIFVSKNRDALESAHVSAHLHLWIDLIFGYKQSGEEAVQALNVFHHLSYEGAINLDNLKDEMEKRAVIGMINNFGQTPIKLFAKPHLPRETLNLPYLQLSLLKSNRRPPVCTFESKLHLPIEKLEVSAKSRKWIGRPFCTSSEDQVLIRKPSPGQFRAGSGCLIINTTLFMNLHLSNITALVQIGNKCFMTGSEDGTILVWKCALQPALSVSYRAVLRGHLSAIEAFCYSKMFKVCLSVDADGGVLQWDLTRFKFVRRILGSSQHRDTQKLLVAMSNDTGNFCTVRSSKYNNMLTVYTLNGEEISRLSLKPGRITAVAFAQVNDSLVDLVKTEYCHSYWSDEFIVLSYASPQVSLHVYKLHINVEGWTISVLENIEIKAFVSGHVTVLQVYKQTEVCEDDQLSRGRLMLVLGDSKGRVYVW